MAPFSPLHVLVFSGYNERANLAFYRFATQKNIPFHIIAASPKDPILNSSYANRVFEIRQSSVLDKTLIETLFQQLKVAEGIEKVFILPNTEYLNRVLLNNKANFEASGIFFGLCNEDLYTTLSDKYSFGELCLQFDIAVPGPVEPSAEAIPFVIKPKSYHNSTGQIQKPVLVLTKEDYQQHSLIAHDESMFCQQYVTGKSFYLLMFCSPAYGISTYSQENMVQQPGGASIIMAKSTEFHKHPITKKFEKLLKEAGFFGLVMIEVREATNDAYMIEANPRLWGPSQLILDAGMNLWELFAADNGLIEQPAETQYQQNIYYLWSNGFAQIPTHHLINPQPAEQFLGFSYNEICEAYLNARQMDIYNRPDTTNLYKIMETNTDESLLKKLYYETSKHSHYQAMHPSIENFIGALEPPTINRYEKERTEWMAKKVDFTGARVLDIGANTGYFSFFALQQGASFAQCYEGNEMHTRFLQALAPNFPERMKADCRYINEPKIDVDAAPYDITFLLNVIHHLGDDFGGNMVDVVRAKKHMAQYLNDFAEVTRILILQVGFCWMGNRELALFEDGTKTEMLEFIADSTSGSWDILETGIADANDGITQYLDAEPRLMERMDGLGEFRNRPIIVLKSKKLG